MKSSKVWKVALLAAALAASGCVVRSVQPWLAESSMVPVPAVVGVWHAEKDNSTLTVTEGAGGYKLSMLSDDKKAAPFVAGLHRVGELLLMDVGPEEIDNIGSIALVPAHLLYRVELKGDSMALHPLDEKTFGARAAAAKLLMAEGGSEKDGYLVVAGAEKVEAFLRGQLKDAKLFTAEPQYLFKRQAPAAAAPAAK